MLVFTKTLNPLAFTLSQNELSSPTSDGCQTPCTAPRSSIAARSSFSHGVPGSSLNGLWSFNLQRAKLSTSARWSMARFGVRVLYHGAFSTP